MQQELIASLFEPQLFYNSIIAFPWTAAATACPIAQARNPLQYAWVQMPCLLHHLVLPGFGPCFHLTQKSLLQVDSAYA